MCFGKHQLFRTCDEGLKEAIATILWVSPRMQADVPELKIVREQIYLKYGKEFVDACLSNANTAVNPKVMRNLNLHAPPCNLCEMYLVEISRSYEVDFKPDPYLLSGGSGGSGGAAMPTAPLVNLGEPPAKPSYDHIFDRGPDCSNLPYPMEPSKDMDSSHMTIPPLPKKTDDDSAYIDLDTPPPYPSGNESGKKKVESSDDSDSDHVYAGMPNDHTGDQDASGKASPPAAPKPSNFNDDDFDDLSARFNRLKQSK
nr:unnamed protein product [Spirometra erinaceieuropaei]